MSWTPTVGILGGNGWLGTAFGQNALRSGLLQPEQLLISRSRRGWQYQQWPAVRCADDLQEMLPHVDVLVLSVRPQDFAALQFDAGERLVISLMACVSMAELQQRCGTEQVVRAMPNAAAEFQQSYTPWLASDAVSSEQKQWLQQWLAASGEAAEISSERQLDYLTGLTGSGPAFPALLASTMINNAVAQGLSEQQAQQAVITTLAGACHILQQGPDSPQQLVDHFMGYRGTTTEGLLAMQGAGLTAAVEAGLAAAFAAAAGERPIQAFE
ncbi:pyrroline-5-carboxylate reductase family protein [Oceanobacter mangrovi]|uniref:pyrroline-5-carboxylate reductase family protein n=1 Tax=Oceanobacter mangrovi TaxID=2862510 RepID=UPI001C8D1322|nr:pyrroline-5-carboxylate reductase dimerization domain-containing protein [Oceanobacter mangrovi]